MTIRNSTLRSLLDCAPPLVKMTKVLNETLLAYYARRQTLKSSHCIEPASPGDEANVGAEGTLAGSARVDDERALRAQRSMSNVRRRLAGPNRGQECIAVRRACSIATDLGALAFESDLMILGSGRQKMLLLEMCREGMVGSASEPAELNRTFGNRAGMRRTGTDPDALEGPPWCGGSQGGGGRSGGCPPDDELDLGPVALFFVFVIYFRATGLGGVEQLAQESPDERRRGTDGTRVVP